MDANRDEDILNLIQNAKDPQLAAEIALKHIFQVAPDIAMRTGASDVA